MGIQDRDYWRERYRKRARGNADPDHWRQDELKSQDTDFRPPKNNELSFIGKLFVTVAVALICVITYRTWKDRPSAPRLVQERPVQRQEPPRPAIPQVESASAAPSVRAPVAAPGQVYRCGDNYSNQPCGGGKAVNTSPPVASVGSSANREIYLCKDMSGQMYWQATKCAFDNRFLERTASVPGNVSWETQVQIASAQYQRARELVASNSAPSYSAPSSNAPSNKLECQALEERVNWLDALGRAGGSGYTMDWIREQRRLARDQQFRIHC